ncbi:MAG: enoyl-CoA hydratase [Proteobacteria bacterium]|nr:enoyl-CoA hydratase [Pseudomonadota bacterium]
MSVLLKETTASGICTLTLNRPDSRNALSDELIAELQHALNECDADNAVQVIIIAAAGSVFCAGHDLREVKQKTALEELRDLFMRCSTMMQAIVNLPKPVIAQVNGMATAAGCQLVASCDLAIASPAARFATPGVHIGLFCSTPMVALARKVGRAHAMQMLLLGEPVAAEQAMHYGLINEVIATEQLRERCLQMGEKLAQKSPLTLAIGKEAFYRQCEMPLADAYDYCNEVMAQNMMRNDAQEGINAFIEKRPPVWSSS